MIITVQLKTGEKIACKDVQSFHLHCDEMIVRGKRAKDNYDIKRNLIESFEVVLTNNHKKFRDGFVQLVRTSDFDSDNGGSNPPPVAMPTALLFIVFNHCRQEAYCGGGIGRRKQTQLRGRVTDGDLRLPLMQGANPCPQYHMVVHRDAYGSSPYTATL